jgi:hypothetical protein
VRKLKSMGCDPILIFLDDARTAQQWKFGAAGISLARRSHWADGLLRAQSHAFGIPDFGGDLVDAGVAGLA